MLLIVPLGILFVLIVWLIISYNQLVQLRNNRNNAFADIDVQLKQRHDLVPQLIETVKGYMKHEELVLIKVTESRNKAIKAGDINSKIAAENQLSSAMSGFNLTVEAYPELKSNTSFLVLQAELTDIENKLVAVRRYFNSASKELNNAVETFPSNLIANSFGFQKVDYFDLGDKQRIELDTPPTITF